MKSDDTSTHHVRLRPYAAPTIWVCPALSETPILGGSDEELHTTTSEEYAPEDGRSNWWSGFDEGDSSASGE